MAGAAISKREAEKLQTRVQSADRRVRAIRDQARAGVATVVHSTESIGSALGFGYINGRYGGVEVLGMPVDALAGGTLMLAGFLFNDEMSPHLFALGTGGLCSFSTSFGQGAGVEARERAEGARGPAIEEEAAAAELAP